FSVVAYSILRQLAQNADAVRSAKRREPWQAGRGKFQIKIKKGEKQNALLRARETKEKEKIHIVKRYSS
ncbi:MAG: hypothetical protein K2G32_00055, partial [Oscillospiraceae bacterium]|nr:hypothetical protein [Oscillospiraceae bacterium]